MADVLMVHFGRLIIGDRLMWDCWERVGRGAWRERQTAHGDSETYKKSLQSCPLSIKSFAVTINASVTRNSSVESGAAGSCIGQVVTATKGGMEATLWVSAALSIGPHHMPLQMRQILRALQLLQVELSSERHRPGGCSHRRRRRRQSHLLDSTNLTH